MSNRGEIFGALESVCVKGRYLIARGWIASSDSNPISGFRVAAAHVNLPRVSWKYGLPNRAAQARVAIANCGFEVRVPLTNAVAVAIRGSLISVTPLMRNRGNWSLFAILKPTLPIPAKRDWALVGSSFLPEACQGLGLLVNDAHLRRNESVLDIGCGVGRMAYVLSYYLRSTGRYEGLEPVSRWVRWNRAVLGARFPNFHFNELPVHNPLYNPRGKLKPSHVRLPYADCTFDVALAVSVFQHNPAAVVRHYLREIARVLRPGGRFLITCFLLETKPARHPPGKDFVTFPYPLKDCWTADPELPERGIAFLESDLRHWATLHNLTVSRKFEGGWRGHSRTKLFQDVIILRK